jgi:prephenate dehydrogenase
LAQRQIAIIGAAGKMGMWFVSYFGRRNERILAYDINQDPLRSSAVNVLIATSISECVKNADIVLVCVPVQATPKVVAECAKAMKSGAVITEISSVKHRSFPALAKVRNDIRPLCLHPMFGPGAEEKKHVKILLIPVRSEAAELGAVEKIFEGATVRVIPSAKEHDREIAVALGLTYFANLVFAKTISRKNQAILREISGTTFRLQSLLAESILTDEPELIVALIKDNPWASRIIHSYLKEVSFISRLVFSRDRRKLESVIANLKSRVERQVDIHESYRRLYELADITKS